MTDHRPTVLRLPTISAQRRFWDSHWQLWQERKVINAWALRRFAVIRELVVSLPFTRPTILDLGCGPGFYTEQLGQLGEVTGIDLSEHAIAAARARVPHVRFLAGDVYELPLTARHFDIVVSQEVISHVQDQAGYVERAAYALKPGGYLILSTDNKFVMDRLGSLPWPKFPPEHIETFLDRRGLQALLAPTFDIVRMTTVIPVGNGGILRLVNSTKLNLALSRVLSLHRLEAFKERAGLGLSIIALARKRG